MVVDPGVGTARRPILVTSDRHHFVAPDNGVLSLVYAREERMHVRHITAEHYFLQPVSNTFHARDVFAPVAAWLAKGVDPEKFGDEITDFVRFNAPKPKAMDATHAARSGAESRPLRQPDHELHSAGCARAVRSPRRPRSRFVIGKHEITEIHSNYAEGVPGEVFGILGSMGYLEIAANRGPRPRSSEAAKAAKCSSCSKARPQREWELVESVARAPHLHSRTSSLWGGRSVPFRPSTSGSARDGCAPAR